MSTTAIVPGSVAAVAQQSGRSLAQSWVNVDAVVLVDVSGSMAAHDAAGGRSRYDQACEELAALQASMPGKIGVIAFSDHTIFQPGGVPHFIGGGTNLAAALDFARLADVEGMRFVVISDGEPDDEQAALNIARRYTSRIDVIYVGSELRPSGREMLERLARASGGVMVTADRAAALAETTRRLLTA